jgi:hypothetical protein
MTKTILALGATALLALPAAGEAATAKFRATLEELNGSGVTGRVNFTRDDDAQTLRVRADITGLTPGRLHLNHIHGRFDAAGNPANSVVPPPTADTDGDGFVEVLEGVPFYGDILLSLEQPAPQPGSAHQGPFADAGGNLVYDYLFDLTDSSIFFSPVTGANYDRDDITPLGLREYVVHGLVVPDFVFDDQSMIPEDNYSVTMPVAAAQIAPVPLPAAGLLLLGALGGLAALRRRGA